MAEQNSDDAEENAEREILERQPFWDQHLRAYLDALPDLLESGHEEGWFVVGFDPTQTAFGSTHLEDNFRFEKEFGKKPVFITTIDDLDISRYCVYFEWKETNAEKNKNRFPGPRLE